MEDPVTLLISYAMGAKNQGEYTYDMFKKGCNEVKADTLEKWYKAIPTIKADMKRNEKLFEKVYMFTFEFTEEPGYKNIDVEYAVALWPILLKDKCRFMDKWIQFVEQSDLKIVKKDQWEHFYGLCK